MQAARYLIIRLKAFHSKAFAFFLAFDPNGLRHGHAESEGEGASR